MAYILIGSGKNFIMGGKEINSHDELITQVKDKERAFLLLYKKGSEQSECSLKNLYAVEEDHD